MTKHDVMWSGSQQDAFEAVREMLKSATLLAYYEPTKELRLENDATEYGLGSAPFHK